MPEPYEQMLNQDCKSLMIEWLATQDNELHKKRAFLQDWGERHNRFLTKEDYRAVKRGETLFGKKPN